MKKLLYFIPILVLLLSCDPKVTKPVTTAAKTVTEGASSDLKTMKDSISYAYGLSISKNFKGMEQTSGQSLFNEEKIRLGIKEGFGGKSTMTEAEVEGLIRNHQSLIMEAKRKEQAMVGEKNKVAGEKFLLENKKKTGVYVTESGLQYIIQREGQGATPTAQNKVSVHYEGRLINGDVFDSSYKRGKPTEFGVGQVIPGWTEGLQLMKPGSKFTFFIPSNLAYGERGAGAKIGPHSTLVFDVELMEIK